MPSSSASRDPETRLGSYIRFLSPVLNGFAGMSDFEASINAFSTPKDFRQFWDLEGKNLIEEFVSDGGAQRMIKGSDVPFLEEFVGDTKRRVGLTEKGLIVLVEEGTEVGDEVWEEAGGLRVKRGKEKDVGEAYIDPAALS